MGNKAEAETLFSWLALVDFIDATALLASPSVDDDLSSINHLSLLRTSRTGIMAQKAAWCLLPTAHTTTGTIAVEDDTYHNEVLLAPGSFI